LEIQMFVRTGSASKASLTLRPETCPRKVQDAQARFLDLLTASRETRAREGTSNKDDRELYRLLKQLARAGGPELDMSHTGVAYRRVSPELWQALGELCGMREPPVGHLTLPRLRMLPSFVAHFPSLRQLTVPGFRGRSLNLTAYPQLMLVDLGTISHETRARIRVPLDCDVKAQLNDGRPALLKEAREGDHKLVVVEPRALQLNCAAKFSDGRAIDCVPLSRQMLRAWRQCHLLGLDIQAWSMGYFHSAQAIAGSVDDKLDCSHNPLEYIKDATPVAESEWKNFVAHQFDKMVAKGQQFAYAVLCSNSHAVPLCFEIFRDQNDLSQRLLRFCETNAITKIRTVNQPASLRKLWGKHQDLFESAFCDQGRTEGDEAMVTLFWVPDPLDDSWGVVEDWSERSPIDESWVGDCDRWPPLFVNTLVCYGWHSLLLQLPEAIAAAGSTERCKSLLLAKGYDDDRPLVHLAAVIDDDKALEIIGEAVIGGWDEKLLNKDDLLQILEARSGDGKSALEAALLAGSASYVRSFLELLLWLHQNGVLTSSEVEQLAGPSNEVLLAAEATNSNALEAHEQGYMELLINRAISPS
jgi:hypothetical protein